MSILMRVLVPLLAMAMIATQVQEERKPVPDEKTQKEFDGIVREVFKDDFARAGASDRKVLVGKLLKQASETKSDPPALFALLTHARTIAAQVGDIKSGTQAVDELIKNFLVDPVALRKAFLAEAAKTAKTTEELAALAEGHLLLADSAAAAESYAEAQAAAREASALARRGKSIPLVNRADARVRELEEKKQLGEGVRKAREALAKAPEDPAANFMVGRQECLAGNWAAGLVHLAKGSDAGWKAAAVKDAAEPSAAADQVAVGDAWWELSEKEKGALRTLLQRRAALWYGRAEGQVGGLTLAKVHKRIAEAGIEAAPSTLALHWAFETGSLPDAKGSVSLVPGRTGKAVRLDGASGHIASVDAGRLALSKTGFTVACWINMAATSSYRLVNKWDQRANRGWLLDLNVGQLGPDGRPLNSPEFVRVRISDGRANLHQMLNGGVKPGAWHHIAMSVDVAQKELKLYVDGAAIGAPLMLTDLTDFDTTVPVAIGTIPSVPGLFFAGMVDEVKIFREPLGDAAVKALAGKP